MKTTFSLILGFTFMYSVVATDSRVVVPFSNVLDNILRLERAVNNMTWELSLTKTDLQNTKLELKNTKIELETTKQKLDTQGLTHEYAFQVKLINHYTPKADEPLKFDDVTMNKGDVYNSASGIFTVPRTGTYLCWANVMSRNQNYFTLHLVKDGKELVKGYTGRVLTHGTATIVYTSKFSQGDHVWFAAFQSSNLQIYGENCSSYGCHLMFD